MIARLSPHHSAVALAFSPLLLGRCGGRWERGLGVRAPLAAAATTQKATRHKALERRLGSRRAVSAMSLEAVFR